jgi:hypothetical protein
MWNINLRHIAQLLELMVKSMVKILSISFRNDELKRITELMKEYEMNRHQVIKLAVRRFLFPHEKTVPLDKKKLNCTVRSQREPPTSQEQDDEDLFADETAQGRTKDSSPPSLQENEDDDFL